NINVERTTSDGTSTGNVNLFAPGAFLGYSWLLGNNKNFIISFFGSVSYSVGNAEIDGEKLPYGGSSAGIGAEVGLVF
ncbi:MAG: hypothetical protein NZ839_04430, partial [Endomicrobia bacterium]|nr:hypothetical protein [Endomicrobiia bacterium]